MKLKVKSLQRTIFKQKKIHKKREIDKDELEFFMYSHLI